MPRPLPRAALAGPFPGLRVLALAGGVFATGCGDARERDLAAASSATASPASPPSLVAPPEASATPDAPDAAVLAGSSAVDASVEDPTVALWRAAATGPTRGPPDALVTVIEFGDYACPYTAKMEVAMRHLRDAYTDDLRVVWRELPMARHPRAKPALKLALEAQAERGESAYWDAHDRLLAATSDLGEWRLQTIAKALGLDPAAARAAVKPSAYASDLAREGEIAQKLAVTGTPTFFVNGRRYAGAHGDRLEALVVKELAAARERLDGGTPRAEVYARATVGVVPAPATSIGGVDGGSSAPRR